VGAPGCHATRVKPFAVDPDEESDRHTGRPHQVDAVARGALAVAAAIAQMLAPQLVNDEATAGLDGADDVIAWDWPAALGVVNDQPLGALHCQGPDGPTAADDLPRRPRGVRQELPRHQGR